MVTEQPPQARRPLPTDESRPAAMDEGTVFRVGPAVTVAPRCVFGHGLPAETLFPQGSLLHHGLLFPAGNSDSFSDEQARRLS